jgi:hypothetical protein
VGRKEAATQSEPIIDNHKILSIPNGPQEVEPIRTTKRKRGKQLSRSPSEDITLQPLKKHTKVDIGNRASAKFYASRGDPDFIAVGDKIE